jgi:hypothetical protein
MSSSHHKILRRISELNQRVEELMLKDNEIVKTLRELQYSLTELMENQVQNCEGDDE